MPDFVDTSVLARYLIQDAPDLGSRAAALIDSDTPLCVSMIVLAELGYVLTRHYRIGRDEVVDAMSGLLRRANIEVYEAPLDVVCEALDLCRPSSQVSFADALTWAQARASGDATVWSFDRRFPEGGIQLREP
jgi:predicted nucleic acid-binding protein